MHLKGRSVFSSFAYNFGGKHYTTDAKSHFTVIRQFRLILSI